MDIVQRRAAQSDSSRHIAQAALHQDHIRRVDRNIRSRSDGNPHICPGQGRRIVDPVPDHCCFAFLLQGTDHAFLSIRKDTRNHLVHSGLFTDGLCGPLIIPRQHDDPDAHILELFDSPGAVLFDHIRHSDDSGKLTVAAEKQRGFPLFCQMLGLPAHGICDLCILTDEFQIPTFQGEFPFQHR